VIDRESIAAPPPKLRANKRVAWGTGLAALLLAAGAGLWAWGSGGAPLSLAVHPGAMLQSAGEAGEWVNSLNALGALVRQRTGHAIKPVVLRDFAGEAKDEAHSAHDLYLGSPDQMGEAIERLHLTPLARFRDFRVNLLVRPEAGIDRAALLKGKRIALYPANSAHGAITMHWLTVNGLRAQDVKLRVSRSPEAMIDALLFGQVDAVALPQYGADEALGRYGGKLDVLGRSEPYPGFVLAAGPQVSAQEARRLTDALLRAHETEQGRAALSAVRIRQTTGTAQLLPVMAGDVVAADARMDRARRQFPGDAVPLEVR